MKIIQLLFVKLMSACVLLLGIALLAALFTQDFPLIDQAKAEYLSWPPFVQKMAWVAAGVALVFIGFIGLMPVLRRKRVRQVSFAGPHGDVFYDLDSVETTIERLVGRMPEVRSIDADVRPADDSQRVEVSADVVLNPTGGKAREAAMRISQQIERAAEQMLGEEGVTKVVLRVRKILVDMKAPLPLAEPSKPGTEAQQEVVGLEEAEEQAYEERRAALAKAVKANAASEAAVLPDEEEEEKFEPAAIPAVETAREAPQEEYAYLPENEEEEEEEKPLLERDEEPSPLGEPEDKSVLGHYDDEQNMPPLEAIEEDEEKREDDHPRPF